MKTNLIIGIKQNKVKYDVPTKTFTVSGTQVRFGTQYMILNEETEKYVVIDFKESTGSEWDTNTVWIYKTKNGEYTLNVLNDDVTPQHAENYLKAKLKS